MLLSNIGHDISLIIASDLHSILRILFLTMCLRIPKRKRVNMEAMKDPSRL